jgi:hypothetical protein
LQSLRQSDAAPEKPWRSCSLSGTRVRASVPVEERGVLRCNALRGEPHDVECRVEGNSLGGMAGGGGGRCGQGVRTREMCAVRREGRALELQSLEQGGRRRVLHSRSGVRPGGDRHSAVVAACDAARCLCFGAHLRALRIRDLAVGISG